MRPFKYYRGCDFGKDKRRYSECEKLMGLLEARCVELGLWIQNPTTQQLMDMFEAAKDAINVSLTTPMGREARLSQSGWRSIYRKIFERRQ